MTTPRFRPPQSAPGTGTGAGARRRATRTSGPPESRSRTESRHESRPESRPRREHDGAERSRPAPAADAGGNRAARRAAAAQESGRTWDGRRDGRAPTTDGPRRGRPARDGGPRRPRDGAAGGTGTDDSGTSHSARNRPDGTRSGGTAAHRGGGTSNGRRPAQGDGGPRQGGTGRGARGGTGTRGRSGSRGTNRAGGTPAGTGPSATTDVTLWTPPESGMPSFADLGLPERLVGALTGEGFTTPFPVQAATLPDTLAGRDLLGRGQTGSGKTLAFGLALLARLAGDRARPTAPLGLVLVPTRELATQVVEVLKPLAKAVDLRVTDVVGGMSMNKQIAELKRGIDVLVATPGRLADHLQQRTADLSEVTITVLDEADRMADMGFLPQVRAILDHTPSDGQRLLFSATLDGDVDALVRSHLTDPVTRSVAPPTAGVDTMEHHVLVVEPDDRARVVAEIAAREGRTILFVRTKHGADRWVRVLRRQGVASGPLHGGRSQSQRNKALDAFRSGEVPVLVATDVAARGIHIDDVGLVVHVDPPADPKAYLHRAGRTARAGEEGVVVTLSTPEQRSEVDLLTKQAGVRPEIAKVVPGHADLVRVTGSREPSGEPIPEPPKPRRARKNPQGGGQRRRR